MRMVGSLALMVALSLAASPGLLVLEHPDDGTPPVMTDMGSPSVAPLVDDPPVAGPVPVAPDVQVLDSGAAPETADAAAEAVVPVVEVPMALPDPVSPTVADSGPVSPSGGAADLSDAVEAPSVANVLDILQLSAAVVPPAGGSAMLAAPVALNHDHQDDDGDDDGGDGGDDGGDGGDDGGDDSGSDGGDDSYGQDRHNLTYCVGLADWHNWSRLINWSAVEEYSGSFNWSSFINWTAVMEQVNWTELMDLMDWTWQDWLDLFGGSGDVNWTEVGQVLDIFDDVDWVNWTELINWSAVENWLDQVNWSNWRAVFNLLNWSALGEVFDAYNESGCDGWEHGHAWRHWAMWFHWESGNIWSQLMRNFGGWGNGWNDDEDDCGDSSSHHGSSHGHDG